MVGAVGAAVAVLLILIRCLMGKKANAPLGLFVLSLLVILGSGFLPAEAPLDIPFLSSREKAHAVDAQASPVNDTVPVDFMGRMLPLGNSFVSFDLYPITSETGDFLYNISVGNTTKSIIEHVSSEELTAFIQMLDFTGTNGNVVLLFEDGTGLSLTQFICTVYAGYGYFDVSTGKCSMIERLGAIWNDTGTGWYYTPVQEMQAAEPIVMVERSPNKYPTALDTTMDALCVTLADNFGEGHYALTYTDTGAEINVWRDNIASSAASAVTGDETAKEAWDLMADSQKILCNTICEQVKAIGQEEYYVTLNVLNDQDTSRNLLTILNGLVIYDAVNG